MVVLEGGLVLCFESFDVFSVGRFAGCVVVIELCLFLVCLDVDVGCYNVR